MENSPNYNLNTTILSSPSEDAWWPVPFHLISNSSNTFSSPPDAGVYTAGNHNYYYYGMGQHQQQQNQHQQQEHQPQLDIAPSASEDSTNNNGTNTHGFGAPNSHHVGAATRNKREPLIDITTACNKRA
jgi:hypothetical protein